MPNLVKHPDKTSMMIKSLASFKVDKLKHVVVKAIEC